MLCIVWSDISKESENSKASSSFNQAFPCSEAVYHSLAQGNFARFLGETQVYPTRRGITGRPTAVWALTGMRMQRNQSVCPRNTPAGFFASKIPCRA